MILANLVKAIREQNYYAVVLEFLIVIAGVVIGFQITAWNEDRIHTALENSTLSRLKSEIEQSLSLKNLHLEVTRQRLDNLYSIEFLKDFASHESFTPELCTDINYSHELYWVPTATPLLDQFSNVGGLEIISDARIRESISRATATRRAVQERTTWVQGLVISISEARPEFIKTEFVEVNNYQTQTRQLCDWQSMHADTSFMGILINNIRYNELMAINLEVETQSLEEILSGLEDVQSSALLD